MFQRFKKWNDKRKWKNLCKYWGVCQVHLEPMILQSGYDSSSWFCSRCHRENIDKVMDREQKDLENRQLMVETLREIAKSQKY